MAMNQYIDEDMIYICRYNWIAFKKLFGESGQIIYKYLLSLSKIPE